LNNIAQIVVIFGLDTVGNGGHYSNSCAGAPIANADQRSRTKTILVLVLLVPANSHPLAAEIAEIVNDDDPKNYIIPYSTLAKGYFIPRVTIFYDLSTRGGISFGSSVLYLLASKKR
jgi:hypothetical protein